MSKVGPGINPYTATIIFGVVQIIGSLFTTQLADRLGRRVLLITSLSGTVMGQTALSTFMYLKELEYDLSMLEWVPVTIISFIIFIASLGVIPLTSICTVEVLPEKVFGIEIRSNRMNDCKMNMKFSFQIRTIGMSINILCLNLSAFFLSKYFPIMQEMIGLYGCLSFMSSACVFGILFVIFVMKETRGTNLDAIGADTGRPETTAPVANNNV